MDVVNDSWYLNGVSADDPLCIHTVEALEGLVDEIGFLPLFGNEIKGFSVEERTIPEDWWSDDPLRDPWAWRGIIAERGRIAYGKFFKGKAGFISRKWFPVFANYRRDGYDFDARWDDELASIRSKKIMDLFAGENADREMFSFEVKQQAGFGKDGEKGFETAVTELEMQTYLVVRDFRQKVNRKGQGYGWHVAVYCTPEHLWGYEDVCSEYACDPKESAEKIFARVRELYPDASEKDIRKVLGIGREAHVSGKANVPYPDNLLKALNRDCDPQTMTPDQKLGLEVAVGQLLEKQQRTLSMKYRDHLKNDEIGREMNRAAGTISGYTSRALSKLRWPRISAWYRDGYYLTVRQYLSPDDERAGICPSTDGEVRDEDPCIAVGLHLKQYYALRQNGINTVGDLKSALLEADWFIPVRGIGPKTAKQIEAKLNRCCTRL